MKKIVYVYEMFKELMQNTLKTYTRKGSYSIRLWCSEPRRWACYQSETGWVEGGCGPRLEAKSCRDASGQRRKGREMKTGNSSRS